MSLVRRVLRAYDGRAVFHSDNYLDGDDVRADDPDEFDCVDTDVGGCNVYVSESPPLVFIQGSGAKFERHIRIRYETMPNCMDYCRATFRDGGGREWKGLGVFGRGRNNQETTDLVEFPFQTADEAMEFVDAVMSIMLH